MVAFGSNLAVSGKNMPEMVHLAAQEIAGPGTRVLKMSRLYASPCFPTGAGPDYVNAAALLETDLDPQVLLDRLHAIEARFGRKRAQRWGPRTLDLDLLAYGDLVLPDPATQDRWRNLAPKAQTTQAPEQLILPHPRLQDRAFVLVPLADVAPDWRHPRLGLTVLEMLNRLELAEIAAVTPLE
jgi:2-amino-4-hydroxy-6-hydroxymethyldihydropteridine diphosphokinase